MSYQALARKWRPGVFADVVGQEHVVRALSNALDRNQVHHAFLFSGTRGVGKTTLARIFAKALNCEKGVSSSPCNECGACQAIDRANFVDLIEVDAASRTKVDDTRELLDNVQYAPTSGRYKVYLIDEVHMLSGHSFNALLKTLEEPPPHVKFLLATTDPQKLPVTVLSRCLQFHLKAFLPDQIRGHLRTILEAEQTEYESGAVDLLARAADGSLRDGLSLLDQALAYGSGSVQEPLVRDMLGTIEDNVAESILRALAGGEADSLLNVVAGMAERACDYTQALDGILSELFNLSLYQASPDVLRARQAERPWHAELSTGISEADVQLFYQIALIGKRDLMLAPDPRTGFEMVLLRMLAFRPVEDGIDQSPTKVRATGTRLPPTTPVSAANAGNAKPVQQDTRPAVPSAATDTGGAISDVQTSEPDPEVAVWRDLVGRMQISGVVRELAMNLGLNNIDGNVYHLVLDSRHEYLFDVGRIEAITAALQKFEKDASIKVVVGDHNMETPSRCMQRLREEKLQAAEQAITEDPNVQALKEKLGATLVKDSIRVREQTR
jgi:DNA polymerase-3 subunit gamma/tau